MNDRDVEAIVRRVFSEFAPEADLDALDPDAMLQDALDLDSMDFLNAMIAIHGATGVEIPEADYAQVATLGGAIRYISERVAAS
jgi:acyl carrier protein